MQEDGNVSQMIDKYRLIRYRRANNLPVNGALEMYFDAGSDMKGKLAK